MGRKSDRLKPRPPGGPGGRRGPPLAQGGGLRHGRVREAGVGGMRHYRVNKLAGRGGEIVKRKDILAGNDREAVARAADDGDCPVCDVWRDGEKVGSIA